MVKIKVISVGKTKESWIREGLSHYQKLLKKYAELQLVEIKEEKITKSRAAEDILDDEAERTLKHLDASGLCVALRPERRRVEIRKFCRMVRGEAKFGAGRIHLRPGRCFRAITEGPKRLFI